MKTEFPQTAFLQALHESDKQNKMHIIDVRDSNDFAQQHIPGSLNMTWEVVSWCSDSLYQHLKKEKIFVLGQKKAVLALQKKGFANLIHVGTFSEIVDIVPKEKLGGNLHDN